MLHKQKKAPDIYPGAIVFCFIKLFNDHLSCLLKAIRFYLVKIYAG